ncbi:hypothetical protein [Oceanobacillus jeddahense]|uniref:hypothetical protein n=1 Tax=Oceanobacillus jeddahense TaxID=1462527 RepID=UPI0006932930|nr:hypothetical protein [Oceanobacillus jeddahense]
MSSLIKIPWVKTGLKLNQKIGILTAYAAGMKKNLFENCGVYDSKSYIIADLSYLSEFSVIIENRGSFNHAKVRQEVVTASLDLVYKNPDIGAVLLECSDLPPYTKDIQSHVQLPVYDFITLINWFTILLVINHIMVLFNHLNME